MTIQKLTEAKLEGTLAKLETSEAKERFLRNLGGQVIQNTVKIPEKYALKIIQLYESSSSYFDNMHAIHLAEKLGMLEKAISLYKKKRYFNNAAELAEKNGSLEQAIDIYELAGKDSEVRIENIIKKLDANRLADNTSLVLSRNPIPASGEMGLMGVIVRADYFFNNASILNGLEAFHKAAKLAKKLGMNERSQKLYERTINNYEIIKHYFTARKVAKEAGMKDRVKSIYEQEIKNILSSNEKESPVDISVTVGVATYINTSRCVNLVDNYNSKYIVAARIAKEAGFNDMARDLFNKAIDDYQRMGAFVSAARIAKEAKFKKKTKELYEAAMLALKPIRYVSAGGFGAMTNPSIDLAEEFGMNKKVVELCEIFAESKEYYGRNTDELLLKGARLAKKIGMKAEAKRLYEKFIDCHVSYHGEDIFYKINAAEIAKEAVMHARARTLHSQAIDLLEKKGLFDEAAQLAKEARIKK